MTAKEVLGQLARRDARIESMRERLARYQELAQGSRSRLRSVSGGGQRRNSSVEEYVSKIVDLTREVDAQIDDYVDLTRAIEATIDALEDGRMRDLLRWRYLSNWNWERISRAMGYEQRQVYRLHALALSAFARAWGADESA